jgi:integrase
MPRRRNDNDPLRRNLSVRPRPPGSTTYEWIYRRRGFAVKRGRETRETKEQAEDAAWQSGLAHKQRIERGEKPHLASEDETKFTLGGLLDEYFRQVEAAEIKQMARGDSLKSSTMYVYGNVELGKRYKQRGFVLKRCKRLAPWLFDKTLAHIGPEDTEELTAKRLQDGVSKDTIAKERQALAYVWKHGRKFEKLPVKEIFADFKLPKWRGRKRRIFKEAWEYRALYEAISTLPRRKSRRLWTMFAYTMLQTAMREEELIQSLWKNFNTEAKTIVIPMEINKSDRDRTIPMTAKLAMRLSAYRSGLSDKQRVPDARVFPINIDNLWKQWRRITQIAGLRPAKGRRPKENLELYALKHTATTNFEGEPIRLVGYELDHMADHDSGTNSPQTRGYVHNDDILVNRIREKLESVPDDPEDMSWDCYAVEDFAFARAFPESPFEWSFPDRHSEGSEWPDIEFIKKNGRVVLDPDKPSTKAYLLKQAEREALALLADYGSDDRNKAIRSEYAIVLRRMRHGDYEPVGEHGRMTAGYLPLEEIPEATACSPLSLLVLDSQYRGVFRHDDYIILSEERIKSHVEGCKDVSALIQQVKDKGKLAPFIERVTGEPTGEQFIL